MKRSKFKGAVAYILPCALFAAMLAWLITAVSNASSSTSEKELSALKTNIENSITMCYAIEGMYPESVEYLCESYGLIYDKSRYYVHYESFASNIRPTVTVLERQA